MLNKNTLAVILLPLALTACAAPNVDTSKPSFSQMRYSVDLSTCHGSTTLYTALSGLGGAIVGSAIGGAYGAYHGAIGGDAPVGAIVGAVIGSAVGIYKGAAGPFEKHGQKVGQCLADKGYKTI
jgi:hypothetical protein